jgi:curli biogenesis system outer membrane secretion channel CsgG
MRKVWVSLCAAAFALGTGVVGTPVTAQSNRPTVAVLDFDFGTVDRWWSGNWDIGKGIADMIVDELVNDGSYRLIERKKLDAIMAEQDLSNSDRADPSAASIAKLKKLLGVKYMVVGSITKFGTENNKKGVGGGAFGGGKFGIGSVGMSKGKATVAITARIIDTSTGEIMVSKKGEGISKRSGLLLGGGGGGGAGGFGGIEMGSSDFRETVLGEATEIAVKDTSLKLVEGKARLTSQE